MKATHAFLSEDAKWTFEYVKEGDNWVLDGDGWVHPVPIEQRLAQFKDWLLSLSSEKQVVVVGHSGVFDKLVGLDMGNCEIVRVEAEDLPTLAS